MLNAFTKFIIGWPNVIFSFFADINDCSPNPCQHGGTCADQLNNFTCTCAAGYTGKNCGIGN